MDPGRIVIRALFGYVWAFILVRVSGRRTIQQSDARCFVVALVLGDMFDDLFWAEIPVAQFVIGVSALLLAHIRDRRERQRRHLAPAFEGPSMRSFAGAVAVALLGLAVSGAATLVGDRMTFVPPPDARVEAFLRQLMTRREELALKHLSRDLRAHMSPAALRRGLDAIEQRIGEIEDVTAQTLSWDRRSAAARRSSLPATEPECRSSSD